MSLAVNADSFLLPSGRLAALSAFQTVRNKGAEAVRKTEDYQDIRLNAQSHAEIFIFCYEERTRLIAVFPVTFGVILSIS